MALQETRVTDKNRNAFYKMLYPVLAMPREKLINLNLYKNSTKIIIDSCAWHYKEVFPDHNIIQVESLQTCKAYQLPRSRADVIYTSNFPAMPNPESVLILDHAPLLKYKSTSQLHTMLTELADNTQANIIIVRMSAVTLGDYRFHDRVKELVNITPINFITTEFSYSSKVITANYKRLQQYDID